MTEETDMTEHSDLDTSAPREDPRDTAGVDRRGFLQCMAWAGTGLVWTATGGVLSSARLGPGAAEAAGAGDFSFVQVSDSHIGFRGEANKDVMATFQAALSRIRALNPAPAFIVHTGDLTHTQKPGAFDTVTEAMKGTGVGQVFYIPGENDVFLDGGKEYLGRFGVGPQRVGWQSFDYKGVHFVGLVNVLTYKAGGLGSLGEEQLEWLEKDVERLGSSTPVVVFAHVPLWAVYPKWGWVTGDGAQALSYLKRFGSVTVLNGHIHQVMHKEEGNIVFHTAMSTAWPQPAPGAAESPGPMKVPADRLASVIGVREVTYVEGRGRLAVVDTPLA